MQGQDLALLHEGQLCRVRATSVGFIFQTFNLIPTLSAQENVEAALVPLHVAAAERRRRAVRALTDVGLGDRLDHLPGELSGGEQQRVAIARRAQQIALMRNGQLTTVPGSSAGPVGATTRG